MNILRGVKRAFRERLLWMCLCGMSGLMLVSCYESDEMNVDPIHAIDLGLSVEWAWCNMGANRPKETGSSCAWGEIAPKSYSWSANKDEYQYYNATTGAFKYLGTNISGTSYDAAHTTLGDGWRMPTKEEMQELIDECSWEWVQLFENDYSVDDSEFSYQEGFLVTGPNGNQIFLPGAHYWSGTNASFGAADPTSYILSASSGDNAAIQSEPCYYAKYIRPVKGEMKSTEDEEETSASLGKTYTVNGVSFKMIGIEKGSFTMGATGEQSYSVAQNDERPTHQVILSDYAIGETEVTQALWQAVMGSNPSGFTGNLQRPVEGVSWYDCQNFIYKLNQLTGENFRLPTEAEWEYAARGGFNSKRYVYSGSDYVHDVAWYWSNSEYSTYPVKRKQANELRIYDMSGNVSEWCYDWYGSYSSATQTDPIGALEIGSTKTKVIRGGGYNSSDYSCRVSSRSHLEPILSGHIGLRLAKSKSNVGVPTQLECCAVTGDVSGITNSGATISGIVQGTDKEVTCGIIYGTSDNLSATNGTMVITTAKGEFSVELTGLEPKTCYYYRAFVVTEEGEYRMGESSKFETKSWVTIGGASNITESGATISGMLEIGQQNQCGIIYGTSADLSSTNGTVITITAQGEFSVDITGLEANTTYYYCAFIITDEGKYKYGEICSFVTKKVLINGHEFVDLGLSVYWATCNVGAETPEEYGDYFAWGETTAKLEYSSSSSVTHGLSDSELESRGIIGSNGNLTAAYDAATANWGGSWRMPTSDEMKELINSCTRTWDTLNGIKGYWFTGPSGNSIFLPAAGYYDNLTLKGTSLYGNYWSAAMSSRLYIISGSYNWGSTNCFYGFSVRPVSE